MMDFSEWITAKYIDWRGSKIGNDGSIVAFSKQFNVSHQLMSAWMKKGGKVPKSQKNITALYSVYKEEIYRVLDLPRPEPPDLPPDLPPAFRALLLAATRELADTLASSKIDPDSPAAEALSDEIMEKHGFKRIKTDSPGKSG